MKQQLLETKYFPHIDGLRAIAVLSVLFFHVDIAVFSGGYVGVDIFFVISGYLITSHLLMAMQSQKFTFSGFYSRRARRLLPALLATIAITFLVGAIMLPTSNFERLANSSIMALFSLSNIFFWSEAGYFDADASLKPLLHMWSLSVEEQFYLMWPALLLCLSRRKLIAFYIVALGLMSLLACEYMLSKDIAAAFFLTPFRIVEFSIGALLVWLNAYRTKSKSIDEILCFIGFALIGLSVFGFSENSRFPGAYALLPCIGAALLIYAGRAKYFGSLLSNRLAVSVGLISYSLYLVHWPLIVFYKHQNLTELVWPEKMVLIVVTFLLAAAMYFIIERPFRKSKNGMYKASSRQFYMGLGISASFLVAMAVHASYSGGWQWRFDTPQLSHAEITKGKGKRFEILQKICSTRGWENCTKVSVDKAKNILVVGDSHSPDGLNIFHQAYPDYHYVLLSQEGCPLLVEDDIFLLSPTHPEREKCVQFNLDRFKKIGSSAIPVGKISLNPPV